MLALSNFTLLLENSKVLLVALSRTLMFYSDTGLELINGITVSICTANGWSALSDAVGSLSALESESSICKILQEVETTSPSEQDEQNERLVENGVFWNGVDKRQMVVLKNIMMCGMP
ncbi:hypothetical protein Tco_1145044 [Tanacetum coccineum]